MATKKVGELIKEARTAAKLTQAQLAAEVTGLEAADIGKAERGEKELTQAQLKQIAKATGVTQASLLNAPKGGTSTAKKTSSASSAKKTSSSAKKTSNADLKLSSTETKLVQAYRKAASEKKKTAMKVLTGEALGMEDYIALLGPTVAPLLGTFIKK